MMGHPNIAKVLDAGATPLRGGWNFLSFLTLSKTERSWLPTTQRISLSRLIADAASQAMANSSMMRWSFTPPNGMAKKSWKW